MPRLGNAQSHGEAQMIEAQGLTKYYGDSCAIEDLSFEVESGEIVGILGLNGAGKTTTLRILSCLLLPSSGNVKIGGLDIYESPHEIRKKVGFLPEEPPLYHEMTVESYLRFAGELRGLDRGTARSRTREVMEVTHTSEVAGQFIGTLSHGFKQRVGIAQAIIHSPEVLILDEPIAGLDPVQIVDMREMIRGLKGRHTILVSSHILPEISQTCDRIFVIQDGQIVATGTEEELTKNLSGGRRLSIVLRGDEAKAVELLKNLSKVSECTVVSRSGGTLHLRLTTEDDVREAVSKAVVLAGLGLLEMAPAEAELESIFIRLTRKKEA
jgi:ABC-2 type transport system ATP-binding protein